MTMTDEHADLYEDTPREPEPERAPAGSILDDLHRRQDELAAAVPEKILDVPAYDGRLVVRYRYPAAGHRQITKAMERAQESTDPDALLSANIDVLRACCDAVLGRTPDGTLVDLATSEPLDDEGVYPKFDKSLAKLLRIDVPDTIKNPGRHIAREVFSPRAQATGQYDGDIALMDQGGQLLRWLGNTSRDIGERLSGE